MDSLKLAGDPLDLEIAGQPLLMENPGKPIDDGQAVFQGDVPFASKHREFV